MPWVKLDDQFPEHPKVVEAGPLAGWLYVCGLAYCQRQLTDGFIPTVQLRRLLPTGAVAKLADRLVTVRLWERAAGGFQVHDYLIYNATREQTLALRQQRASAGRKGGWQKAGKVLAERQASATTPEPIPEPSSTATPTEHLLQEETPVVAGTSAQRTVARVRAEPPKRLEPAYSAEFDGFWAIYPRHRDKAPAFKAYETVRKRGATPAQIETAARHFADYVEETGTEEEHVPYAATWLGQGKWLDFRERVAPPMRPPAARNGHTKPPNLAQSAAHTLALQHLRETSGDERTSYWDLAKTAGGVHGAADPGADGGALPGPPPRAPLARGPD